jgi:hypothetical protein
VLDKAYGQQLVERTIMKHYVIGAGGTGGYLLAAVSRLVKYAEDLVIIDADTVEERNLSRQVFSPKDIGRRKAEVLAERFGGTGINAWFGTDTEVNRMSVLWGCPDNNACRMAILQACNRYNCVALLGGNEHTSSEAVIYFPEWQGTKYDYRVIYPSAATDASGRPDAPCNSDVTVKDKPQTICANFTAACFMLRLYFMWCNDNGRITLYHNNNKPRSVHLRAERSIMFEALIY